MCSYRVVGSWLGPLLVANCCMVTGGSWVACCLADWWPGSWADGRCGGDSLTPQTAIETGWCQIGS